jgi:hypothetical protein
MSEQPVTFEQYQIYLRYRGDEDGFSRVATDEEKRTMAGVNWSDVTNLLQGLNMVRKGLASANFEADVVARARAAGLGCEIPDGEKN